MSVFIDVEVYKYILKSPTKFSKKVRFDPDDLIKISCSAEGGGGGFGALIIFNLSIESKGKETQHINEKKLGFDETPVTSFVKENVGSLFEKVC